MLIIVEGIQDKYFIESYLKHLSRSNPSASNEYMVKAVDGKNYLSKAKQELEEAISKKDSIKIIFDADNDFSESKNNITNKLEEMGIGKTQYNIFLLPNNEDKGALEDLIKNIAKHPKITGCFNCYVKCIEQLQKDNEYIKLPQPKSIIFAYLECFGFSKIDKIDFKEFEKIVDFSNLYLNNLKEFLEV